MKTIKIIVVLLFGIMGSTFAQINQETQSLSYVAYLKSSTTLWEKVIEKEKYQVEKSATVDNKFNLAMAYYGLLNATMASKDESTFDKYLGLTKELLEEIIDEDGSRGEAHAVLSSVMGLEMAYSPMKGMYLGYKSSSHMSSATEKDPDSPLVVKLFAGSKLYTPSMFGGDIEAARDSFIKAVEIFEKTPENIIENWLYLDALAHLGIAYQKLGDHENAKRVYEKALRIEPAFDWVGKALLPSLIAAKG